MLLEVHSKGIPLTDSVYEIVHRRRRQVLAPFSGLLKRARLELRPDDSSTQFRSSLKLELVSGRTVEIQTTSRLLTRCISQAFCKAAREAQQALRDTVMVGAHVPVSWSGRESALVVVK